MHKCRIASIVIGSAFGLFIVLGIVSIIVAPNNDNRTTASNPPRTAATSTPTATPIPWYTPAEITAVYQSHITRAHVMFEQGEVFIQSTLAEMHPSRPGLVYLVERRKPATDLTLVMMETDEDRAAKDWRVIRAQLPAEQVAALDIGDAIGVRCERLEPDPNVGTGAELVCLKATLIR